MLSCLTESQHTRAFGKVARLNPRLIHILNFLKGRNGTYTSDGIYSQDAFRVVFEKAKARSQRTGESFSLVLFGCRNGNGADIATLARLGKDIIRKTRKSDEVGWYGGNCIGAILPGSSADEAWKFVEIVKKRTEGADAGLNCAVYTYPSVRTESNVERQTAEEPETLSEPPALFKVQSASSRR